MRSSSIKSGSFNFAGCNIFKPCSNAYFFTGDAETVNFMKEVAEVEEGKRCDCCGQLITTPLWDMPYGSLCDECSKRLDEQVHGKYETPWQKVEQGREERSTPWWFDL